MLRAYEGFNLVYSVALFRIAWRNVLLCNTAGEIP